MKIYTGFVTNQGAATIDEGLRLVKTNGKVRKTVFEIGRQNTGWNHLKVRIGDTFAKSLEKDSSCTNDGIGEVLGICPDCGIEITETNRKKIWGKYGESNLDIWKWGAAHTIMTKIERPTRGTFLVMNVGKEKKLLLVEERKTDRKDEIALLLYAEPQKMGRTSITCPPQPAPWNRIVGQRWISKNPSDGVGAERLMLLKAGDHVIVKQLRYNGYVLKTISIIVTTDLSVRVANEAELAIKAKASEIKTAPTPKEVNPPVTSAVTTDC